MKTYLPCRAARGAVVLAALLPPAPVLAQGALAQDVETPPDPSGIVRFGHESATDAYRPGGGSVPDAAPAPVDATPVSEPVREPQEPSASDRDSGSGSGSAAPDAAARPGLGYESAFDAYERYEESDGPDWRGANDRVGEIGGWKTYAREPYESATDGEID